MDSSIFSMHCCMYTMSSGIEKNRIRCWPAKDSALIQEKMFNTSLIRLYNSLANENENFSAAQQSMYVLLQNSNEVNYPLQILRCAFYILSGIITEFPANQWYLNSTKCWIDVFSLWRNSNHHFMHDEISFSFSWVL